MNKDYSDYETQRAILMEYMQVMIARGDWHGVSDAANDLRVLEAEQKHAEPTTTKRNLPADGSVLLRCI